jgi:glycosyltransferase involved in cell wall biosynthesis
LLGFEYSAYLTFIGKLMHLLLITETFSPEVNGVARTLGRWVQAFRERGHTVSVIRPRQKAEGPDCNRVYGMALPFYPEVRIGVVSPGRLRRKLMAYSPDLVHIATEGPLGFSGLRAARGLGLPIASSFHTNFDHYAGHYGLLGIERLAFAYLRWFHNLTQVTLVPSLATQRRLVENSVQRVEIWSRGVDSQLFNPAHRDPGLRQSLGLGQADPLLLYVGRLAPEKNLDALLVAFNRLRQQTTGEKQERLRLALVGAGPREERLRMSPPQGVILAGEHHGLMLSRWYASADLFAFPSLSETFGNVMLEAQASGLPVVGFDCQGVNERVTPDEDGYLVPMGGDLTLPLAKLCANQALREQFGRAARAKAESQDWKPIFDELEDRYSRLVSSHAAANWKRGGLPRPATY